MAKATIPYIKGFEVKPHITTPQGVVYFTNGVVILQPNQVQCEAYGYTYDETAGICRAFNVNPNLNRNVNNTNNFIKGTRNTTGQGTNNTQIFGEENTVKGMSRNNIIAGTKNEIVNGVNNTFVYGTLGQARNDNSIVLGGNAAGDTLGERQSFTLMYGCQTTNNSTVDSFLNNTTDSYFIPEDNAVYYFQSETLAVRVAGSSGSGAVGDFKSWVERGVVKNAAGTLSIDRSRTSPADSGTTSGWSPINAVSGSNFRQTVKGATNMTIEWVSTIRIMQIKTGVTLS
jgi:hypothetical protein